MWTVQIFESSEQLQTYLRASVTLVNYFKTVQAGGLYFLFLYS